LLRFINHTNRVSVWIANSILKERDVRNRARIMTNFVTLCSVCHLITNDHQSWCLKSIILCAVLECKQELQWSNGRSCRTLNGCGFQTQGNQGAAPFKDPETSPGAGKVDVFTQLLQKLPRRPQRQPTSDNPLRVSALLFLSFSPLASFLSLFLHRFLSSSGILLSDLTFAEDGNPDFLGAHMINWSKRSLLYGLLSELTTLQRTCYYKNLSEHPIKKGFMLRLSQQQIATEELYNISLKLEPREKAQLRHSGKESTLNLMAMGLGSLRRFSASS